MATRHVKSRCSRRQRRVSTEEERTNAGRKDWIRWRVTTAGKRVISAETAQRRIAVSSVTDAESMVILRRDAREARD
ncbi:hypothetical protein M0804_009909 [Polistes exclamans]|nr:hypothetical protein M0804_009909 [Polistes exclamans]